MFFLRLAEERHQKPKEEFNRRYTYGKPGFYLM
jgi:hypothetical protein